MPTVYDFCWDENGRGVWVAPPNDPCWKEPTGEEMCGVPIGGVLIEANIRKKAAWDEEDIADANGFVPTGGYVFAPRVRLEPGDGVELEEGRVLYGFAAINALKKLARLAQEWDQFPTNEEQWELLTQP